MHSFFDNPLGGGGMFGAYWNYCQISDGVLYYAGLRPTENEVHSMNKTFKIVFNKARGALMVANEITGSVQKKGVRTAIATALVAMSAASMATELQNATYETDKSLTDEDIVFVAPATSVSGYNNSLSTVAQWVKGSKFSIENNSSVTFNSANKATNNSSQTYGSGHHALAVTDGGSVLISTKELNLGTNENGGGDRGIRMVGSGNTLTLIADKVVSYTGDEFIHVREGDGSSVANIGTANQRISSFYAKTGWGKDDYGVALFQANEGNTINFYAVDATLDGPTGAYGGVFGSGSNGTINADVSGTLTIDGNLCGSYGTITEASHVNDVFMLNVKATKLVMSGDINAGMDETGYSTGVRTTLINLSSEDASITGDINAQRDGHVGLAGNIQASEINLTKNGEVLIGARLIAKDSAEAVGGTSVTVDKISIADTGSLIVKAGSLSANSISFASGSLQVENGVVSVGSSLASAQSAMAKMSGLNATSILYIGKSIGLGNGQIVVGSDSPSTQIATYDARTTASVNISSDGALIVDQAAVGDNAVFTDASVTFNGGQLGIANATPNSTLTLSEAVEGTPASVVTDNPFISGSYSEGVLTTALDSENGLGALASTGIQAMTRRADTVLAQTIADRTSLDQELAAGTNLWVDVTGERYEADKLDNGGEFKSDMGYGAFGADFAVTQDITAGAAFQYGKGSLRSGVSSIKNSIDSYGVTAYGAMKFGDSRVVAEASYIKNENDITSSQTALNQSVDSEIYSVGVRGQHRFTAGNFQFVPSVGVRVSRLNTDAMQVGAVNIKKQEQTLVQMPIALRVNGFEQNVSGWSVAPSFKIAYVPTFGDKEISVLGADQTVIDTSPVQGDFGIRAQNGNLMVNANMMLGGGKDGTSSVGGKMGLKYVF